MIVAARYVRVAAPAGMPTKIATSITVCLAVDHRPRKVSILISFIPRDNQTVSVRQGDLAVADVRRPAVVMAMGSRHRHSSRSSLPGG
jgi:hypothetical protein